MMRSDELWAITGASGFIGGALTQELLRTGHRVRGLSRKPLDIPTVLGDIRDRAAVSGLAGGAGVIVHLAAYVHRNAESDEERRECWSVNTEGSRCVVDAAASQGAFLIFVSSANVYAPSEDALSESAPCVPRTPYGRSKLEAESIVGDAIRTGRIRGCILRPAMVFGPNSPGNLSQLIRLVRMRVVPEIDQGRNRKSLVPVGQLVDAIVAVSQRRDRVNGEIFNVAGGDPMTMREIVDVIASAQNVRPLLLPLPRRVVFALAPARLRGLIETFVSSAVLCDVKLASLLSTPRGSPRAALAETARAAAR